MKTKTKITISDISGSRIMIPAGTRTTPAYNIPMPASGKRHRWVSFGRWATAAEKRQWKFGILLTFEEVKGIGLQR
jgi:hypothetical protein